MSWAVICDQSNFPTLNMKFCVKLSRIIRKDFRVHPGYLLGLALTRQAFQTFETSWFSSFPMTNIGSFSPTSFPAARPVKRTLLNFPSAHSSPFERILLEAVSKINQTHQRCKYLSFHTLRVSWANGSAPNLLSFSLCTTFPRQKQFEKQHLFFHQSSPLSEALKSVMLSSFAKSKAFSYVSTNWYILFKCIHEPFTDSFINGIMLSNT